MITTVEHALREIQLIVSLLDIPCKIVPKGTKLHLSMATNRYCFEYDLPWKQQTAVGLRRMVARLLLSVLERWSQLESVPAPLPVASSQPVPRKETPVEVATAD